MIINRCCRCMEDLGTSQVCPKCGYDPAKDTNLTYALRPNTILHGKYLIGKVLGQGGFGITYIGFDLALELKVAIKEYFPFNQASRNIYNGNDLFWQNANDSTEHRTAGFNTFLAEARKMAKINSVPEIVSVRDTFEENKTAYIVMDYVPGLTVKDYIQKRGILSYEESLNMLLPLIQGLDTVHRQGIIHRDISPSNLMLSPQGKIYLLDLGAAKDVKKSTGKSEMVATKGYSPMEQYTNSSLTGPWSDVYSMTASIYYCLFGQTPPAAIDRVENDTLSFKGKTKKPLTAKQIAVLKKGMALNKADRYQNIVELLNALQGARKKSTSKALLIGTAIAAGLVALAAVILLLTKTPWDPTVQYVGTESPYLDKNLVVADDSYKYYVDKSGNLVCISYDKEAKGYYADAGTIVYAQNESVDDDGVAGLAASGNYVYATYHGGANKSDYLIRLEADGENPEKLLELDRDHSQLQYTKLSSGKEYFYYMQDTGEQNGASHMNLFRYDVKKNSVEHLIAEDLSWYALQDRYIYYTLWDKETRTASLMRAGLDGTDPEVLNTEHYYPNGFAADGQLYLLRSKAPGSKIDGLVQVDAEGKPVQEDVILADVPWANNTWTIGNGWVYYWKSGTDALYRVRLDGSENTLVLEGYTFGKVTHHDGELYFQDGSLDKNKTFRGSNVYIAADDGSAAAVCSVQNSSLITASNGVEYQIENGEAIIKDYVGDAVDVLIPSTIEGFPVREWDPADFASADPETQRFYKVMDISELTYTTSKDGVTITGYTGAVTGGSENLAIPSQIEGKTVIALGDQAFQNAKLVNLYLPQQLQSIGVETFDGCATLKRVIFPDSLISIDSYAFFGCSLDGQVIQLPEGLIHLGMGVFYDCTPRQVHLPATLTSLDEGFMAGCGGEYIVNPEHETMRSTDGVILSRDGLIFYACSHDRTGSYTVPNGVVEIYSGAFYGCQVDKIIVPDSVTTIGNRAFLHCAQLQTVILHKGVKQIGERAFVETGLTEIVVPYSCKVATDTFGEGLVVKYFS